MKHYTLVGSRETSQEGLAVLARLVHELAKNLYIGRSGGADGADSVLEYVLRYSTGLKEVYLPWDKFNGRVADGVEYINAARLSTYTQALRIAKATHPAWERCSQGAQKLHARNVYQVLGKDLKSPSKVLICWAQPTTTGVKGGTNTAVQLAKSIVVPVLNVHGMNEQQAVSKLFEIMNIV